MQPATFPKLLYRVAEAAEMLGQGRSRIYVEMARGRLGFVRAGARRLIPSDALDAYVSLLKDEAAGEGMQS